MTKQAPLSLRRTSGAERPHSSSRSQGGEHSQHGAHAHDGGHGGSHSAKSSFGAKGSSSAKGSFGAKSSSHGAKDAFGKSSSHGAKSGGKGPASAGKGSFGAKSAFHGSKSSDFKGKGTGFKSKHQGNKASRVKKAPAEPRVFTTGKDFNVVPKHTKAATASPAAPEQVTNPITPTPAPATAEAVSAAVSAAAPQIASSAHSAAYRNERNERYDRGERHERSVTHSSERSSAAAGEDAFAGARQQLQAYVQNMQHEAIGTKSRAAAAYIIHAVTSGMSLTEAIPYFTHPLGLDARDHAFVQEIVYGTLRHRRKLMHTLNPLFSYKVKEKHRIIPCLLLSALYQLTYMQVPPHAVVAASVSACGACGLKGYASLVNAILRRFLREGGILAPTESLAEEYSFPDWLLTRLEQSYTESELRQILEQSNEKAPLFVRVENSKISTADYLAMLQDKGIAASGVDFSPCTVRLANPINVSHLPGFNEGLCTVQDLSAQLAAPLLELQTPEATSLQVLDCCCAPGGKTAHILDLNPQAEVTAIDVDDSRLQQTRSTLERLQRLPASAPHPAKVHLKVADAQDLSQVQTPFDRILVDAPCSGTGVIRRHPDIKWLRRQKDIPALCETQQKILEAAWAKLKDGGILLYTTCSILPEENKEQIESFVQQHADAQVMPLVFKGQEYQYLQRLPGDDGGDGFFYARLRKVALAQ